MTIISTSTSAFYDRSTLDIADLRKQAEGLQADLSTGQKISRSSDDPVGASRMRQLQRADSLSQIDVTNAAKATADLQLTDGAVGSLADYIGRLNEPTTQAANGTMTPAARAGIGTEIEAIRGNIIQLANSRDSAGNALFGGQSAGDAYSVDAAGNATYIGTATAASLPLGDGQNVTRAMTGPELLSFSVNGQPTDLLASLKTLADALKAGGSGVTQAMQDGLGALDQGLNAVTTAQTVIGSRLSWIDLTTERRTTMSEMRTSEENDVGGTDIASTVAKLQETMTVLQASQASFTKLAGMSLFELLH